MKTLLQTPQTNEYFATWYLKENIKQGDNHGILIAKQCNKLSAKTLDESRVINDSLQLFEIIFLKFWGFLIGLVDTITVNTIIYAFIFRWRYIH